MKRRMGFTVIEIMVVVVIAGLIVLLGMPKVRRGMIQTNVRGARVTVVNLLAKARASATQTGRRTWLKFNGNMAFIIARPRTTVGGAGDVDTLGGVENLATRYGVTLSTTADSIAFDPRGLGGGWLGSDATITVTKSSHYNKIKVDGLGRITQ